MVVHSDRTSDKGYKLERGKLPLDISKDILPWRQSGTRQFLDFPSLEMLRILLDKTLSNLV